MEEIKHRGIEPDVITYSAAISACEKGGQWKHALRVLEEMRSSGTKPTVISYSAAISACEKGGQWERALELLEEMKSTGVEPDVISYNGVLEDLPPSELPQARNILKQAIAEGHYRVWNARGEMDMHLTNSGACACTAAVARVILYHTLLEFANRGHAEDRGPGCRDRPGAR